MEENNEFESAFSTGKENNSPIFSGRDTKPVPEKKDAKSFKKGLILAFGGVIGFTFLIVLVVFIMNR
ncbi:Uncharacterised protein [Streptococcus criceti]|uniref:Uncharacterized protein n=1 Tax=Streptococcus criceti HS-6 TaxID=873449 RepID=G5JQQ9_STRCG|nr:hypothetical protein [Streptococcus criceti]EHI73712.1 hypothetical protein STRCR_1863 [Streptococcus criceti HS-6]SUN43038.1 Uncharacterised protein [Streptococcus criceti]